MIAITVVNERCIIFTIPKEENEKKNNEFWRLERYLKATQKYQPRLLRLTEDQTTQVSYDRRDKELIERIIQSKPIQFWTKNNIYLILTAIPGIQDIFLESYPGGRDSITIDI